MGPLVFLCVDICGKIHSYTDTHDVDEDRMTTNVQGARWTDMIQAGIVCRNMWYSPTSDYYDGVASSDIRN